VYRKDQGQKQFNHGKLKDILKDISDNIIIKQTGTGL